MANALYNFAKLLVAEGQRANAVQILACILGQPTCWQAIKDRAAVLLEELESELPEQDFAEAEEQGKKRGLGEMVAGILERGLG